MGVFSPLLIKHRSTNTFVGLVLMSAHSLGSHVVCGSGKGRIHLSGQQWSHPGFPIWNISNHYLLLCLYL